MSRIRKTPYTALGIRKVPCKRCGKPSHAQWNACAAGPGYFGLCPECDVALNKMVLRFMGFSDWKDRLAAYVAKERS